VSIFLTETDTRHSLLTKHKHFREKLPAKLQSNSNKLTDATNDAPIDVDDDVNVPVLRREDSDDEPIALDAIPDVGTRSRTRQSKRNRGALDDDEDSEFELSSENEDASAVVDVDAESDSGPPHKRRRRPRAVPEEEEDDKKKMAMDVSYEGFALYGRVLCLVVKKRDSQVQTIRIAASSSATSAAAKPSGQAVMENWITSTQMPAAGTEDDAA
jgi:hypothetical protein